jgi:hypothetical protein
MTNDGFCSDSILCKMATSFSQYCAQGANMKVIHRSLFVFIAVLFIGLGVACGEDSDADADDNNSNNNSTADTGNNGPDVDPGEVPDDWEYGSEYHLRFTSFELDRESPGYNLNGLLKTNIDRQYEKYPIVVLIHLRDIDTAAGELSLRGGAGLKADLQCDAELDGYCEYQWDPDSPASYYDGTPFDADTGEIAGAIEHLDFIATFELDDGVNKAVIPVQEIEFDATVFPYTTVDHNGDAVVEVGIDDARLTGYVTEEDADNSEIQIQQGGDPIKLSSVLDKDDMNHDVDGDGTDDAWMLEGTFSARQTVVVDE